MPSATLHPNPALGDAATLSLVDGWLVATLPDGTSERFRIGPDGVTVFAHYTTVVLPPRGSSVRRFGVPRSGWRLLDAAGHPLAWLGNTDRPLYDDAAARRFAAAAGLEVRDLGEVPPSELAKTRPDSPVDGPGTGTVTTWVAPPFQWALAASVLAGILLVGTLGAQVWEDGRIKGWAGVVFLMAAFVSVFLSVFVGNRLGCGLAALRWRGHWRREGAWPEVLLPADRVPGLALTVGDDGIDVRDLRGVYGISRRHGLALQPYEIDADRQRYPAGLLVRSPRKVTANVPGRFQPDELRAFAGAVGAEVWDLETEASQVPKAVSAEAIRQNPQSGKIGLIIPGRPSCYGWGRLAWVLTPLAPAFAAVALAIAFGWLDVSYSYAWLGGALAMYAVAGWAMYATNVPVWLRRPALLARTPSQGRG